MKKDLRIYTRKNIKKNPLHGFFYNLSVTNWIIVVNIVFFIIAYVTLFINSKSIEYIALQPSFIFEGKYLWTFLTSMFMHANFFHLAINMFVLFSLGNFCEKIIGRKRFFWFYILAGLLSGVAFVVFSGLWGETALGAKIFGSPLVAGVGASGAIFAIAGLFVVLTPKLKFIIIFLPFFSLPAYIMIPLVLFLTWAVSAGTGLPVGNTAHFGGFLAGLIYGFYLRHKYYRRVRMLEKYVE